MKIVLDRFDGGLNSYVDDDHLRANEGTEAVDCLVGTGSLYPLPDPDAGVPDDLVSRCRLNNPDQCYVEWGGYIFSNSGGVLQMTQGACSGGRPLGLEKPSRPQAIQTNTPGTSGHHSEVIGPSADGSGKFGPDGTWRQSSFIQQNVWTFTNLDTGASTVTVDEWVICDTPPFNITKYYALKYGNPELEQDPPARNAFGCADTQQDCDASSQPLGPSGGGTGTTIIDEGQQYLEKDTSYAVAFWNEDLEEQSTVSDTVHFVHQAVVKTKCWSYGPLEGNIPADISTGWSTEFPDPTQFRGNVNQSVAYTGVSHLHQVRVHVPSPPQGATHTILYWVRGGSYVPIAKTTGGAQIITAQTLRGAGSDPDLARFSPVFRHYEAPQTGMECIAVNEAGVFAAYKGSTLWVSEANSPDLWSEEQGFKFHFKHEIRSVTPYYAEFFVTTAGRPVRIVGSTPGRMSAIEQPDNESNLNGKSTAHLGRYVAWAGPQGVSMFNGQQSSVVTRTRLSRADWKAIIADTSALVGVGSEQVYLLFHANGCLVVDMRPESKAITTWTLTLAPSATFAVYDVEEDRIFFDDGRALDLFKARPTTKGALKATWKSGRVNTDDPRSVLAWGRVHASGPVELRVRNDHNEEFVELVDRNSPFRIGLDGRPLEGDWFYVETEFKHRVRRIELASSIEELQA